MDIEKLAPYFKGVAFLKKGEKGIIPQRLTDRQLELYAYDEWINKFARCASGVVIDMMATQDKLSFSFDTQYTRMYPYYIDVYENGRFTKTVKYEAASGKFEYTRLFGPGESRVEIYLSNIVYFELFDINFGDIKPAPQKKIKMLALGDSITMGMDGEHPSMLYGHQIARYFDAEFCTTAVGGAKFDKRIIDPDHPFEPDMITSAYGINDCSSELSVETILSNADEYFKSITERYPGVPVTAVTPLWMVRLDYRYPDFYEDDTYKNKFEKISDGIRELCLKYGFNCVNGLDLVPYDENFFGDLALHPNDKGFSLYAMGVIKNSVDYFKSKLG